MFKEEVKSLVSGEDGVLLYKLPFHRSYDQKNFQRTNVHTACLFRRHAGIAAEQVRVV